MKKSGFVDAVRVGSPCSEDWNEMTGNDQVRFCSHCSKNVNNLSAITRKEAKKLVAASGGSLCIRYAQHPRTGAPIFAPKLIKIAGRAGLAAGVLGASIAAAQPVFAQGSAEPVRIVRADQAALVNGASAKITGTVFDPQGAVIPFALVSLTNTETGDFRTMNADAEGNYQFAELPAGHYSLKAEASGFKTFEANELRLEEGSLLRTNAILSLPSVDAVVQVKGNEYDADWGVTVGVVASIVNSNPLVAAVMRDDLEEVKVRVAMRERINARDKSYDGMSPLHAAVQNGNAEIARFLLERGAKANIRDFEKRTPLMMLDEDATPEMLQLLLTFGAKLKLMDKGKNTALHHAALNGADPELIRTMINYGVNANAVNKEGKTALMIAAEENDDEAVAALLEAGADPGVRTRDGRTAADLADGDSVRAALFNYGAIPNK